MPPTTRRCAKKTPDDAAKKLRSSTQPDAEADEGAAPKASLASAQLLHEDGGLVLNILGGLCAESLARMCCVSRAWASTEAENRRALWRPLCLERWPDLGEGRSIDWRKRYRVLLRDGVPVNQEKIDDPLADYSFVVQGRWVGSGCAAEGPPLAFSAVIRAGRYSATVSMHGNGLEFGDAFELSAEFEPVSLPQSWSDGRAPPDRLDVSILVRCASDQTVAHLLAFSVAREAGCS